MVAANGPEYDKVKREADRLQLQTQDLAIMTLAELRSLNVHIQAVDQRLAIIDGRVDGLVTKVVLSLLGLVAANVGLKFVGTPWYVDLAIYMSWFATIFLAGSMWFQRRNITPRRMVIRVVFISGLLFSIIMRSFVFEAGVEAAPWYYPLGIDIWLAAVSATFIWSAWISWDVNGKQ
jgi:hypothetical protein